MWKDIEGFNGLYQVSSQGNIRRVKPDGTTHLLTLRNKNNCICVVLRCSGRVYLKSVAKLVALAFIGAPPLGTIAVKHIDGDYTNNCVNNICWNIPRAHTLPENTEARRLYHECCYSMMRTWAKMRNLSRFRINGYDIEDVFQEAAMKIWRYIDGYDPQRAGFFTFVRLNCDSEFNRLYKREVNKPKSVNYMDGWQTERYRIS